MSFAADDAASAAAVEGRLRRLGQLCAVPAAAALAAVAVQVWELGRGGDGGRADPLASPPGATFALALVALFLVLLSSAVRARILRRCEDAEDAEQDEEGEAAAAGAAAGAADEEAAPPPSAGEVAARRLAAYTWATAACFAMLAVATGLGLWMALTERALLYGLAVCATSLVTMAVRWPGTAGFARAFGQESAPAA